MDRTVMWMQWNNLGMEQLHIENNQNGIMADSVVVGVKDGKPFRTRYQIDTDQDWQVRNLQIELLNAGGTRLTIRSDKEGQWWQNSDQPIPKLGGCLDVDLSATPFTNTLAIRRLALQPGDSCDLTVVYVAVPEMQVRAVPQRYTCLEINSQGGIYRYEALTRNFSVDLLVDRDGLVIEYPQTFRRIWSVEEPR
ncbi:putative glycolipid-binding domain-containing protein [Leptolyngbya sp. 7M]|uniref:putative glycolipid-binding domain-containing protein n=1 Tax=Leptolyngbya sp. 7M TaxID=2812896 RepID=UPI001B8AD22A|nr:putative glycolipid-binding domain-containing protein [Leptolyngbya sp. 7M]QYO62471.1 putative glycolipid-binding domain-containing protein [Leptolyngbya sp. 7M]